MGFKDNFKENTGCDRNASQILNSHLCGARELRQGAMIAPCLITFLQIQSVTIIALIGTQRTFAIEANFYDL